MDDQRFDVLTRVFSACTSRRQVLGLLAAMAIGSGRPTRAAAAQDDGSASTCDAGQTYCPEAGVCIDTCCNNDHCGACGNVCTGGLTCFEGVCDCPSGLCPPVKLPNTGRGGAHLETGDNRWSALAMTGAAAVSALMWRVYSRWGVAQSREDR